GHRSLFHRRQRRSSELLPSEHHWLYPSQAQSYRVLRRSVRQKSNRQSAPFRFALHHRSASPQRGHTSREATGKTPRQPSARRPSIGSVQESQRQSDRRANSQPIPDHQTPRKRDLQEVVTR